jgi:glutamine synthetase
MPDLLAGFLDEHPLVDGVDLLLPDLVGVPRGKRIPVASLASALRGDATFTSTLYSFDTAGANVDRSQLVWEEGDADRPLALDPATLRIVPWQERRAQIIGGLLDHDRTPFFANPRTVLQSVAGQFGAHGLRPVAAIELEFYLLDLAFDASGQPQLPDSPRMAAKPRESETYTHERIEDQAELFDLVERWCEAQALPYHGTLAEYAPGQFEVNLGHRDDMLTAADEALMLKRVIKAAARATGQRATFMAKPFEERSGSGLHVHVSLIDAQGRNAFAAPEGGEALLRKAVAGMQRLMAESMLVLAPNANSYRRFVPRSYAPLAPSWGHNNRTVALRIPAGPAVARRIEHRVAGADANPYLALAAVLAGILDGLEHGGDPGPPITGNAYDKLPPSLPTTWDKAIEALRAAERLPARLGARFCRHYVACRQAERDRFQARVTPTEIEWYLSVV